MRRGKPSRQKSVTKSGRKKPYSTTTRAYDYDAAWQPDLLRPEFRGQRALSLGQRNTNYMRHVGEYLKYQRKNKALETSYKKRPQGDFLKDAAERARLLAECERRKARREVLHASGKAGAKKRYPARKKPGQRIKC